NNRNIYFSIQILRYIDSMFLMQLLITYTTNDIISDLRVSIKKIIGLSKGMEQQLLIYCHKVFLLVNGPKTKVQNLRASETNGPFAAAVGTLVIFTLAFNPLYTFYNKFW
ncbi:hypothetical protein ACJX0J_020836, partial [Zea mays]